MILRFIDEGYDIILIRTHTSPRISSETGEAWNIAKIPKNINKNYGKTIALKDLSLTARSGEILGVIGPNGAGKSTMIKILSGEETDYEGFILLDG